MRKSNLATVVSVSTSASTTMTPEFARALKARRNQLAKVDKALGKQKDGKYKISGNTYENKTDACVAGRINPCTANRRIGEYGMSYEAATDLPRFSVMKKGNDRPVIGKKPADAATDAYWPVPLPNDFGLMSKKYGYDSKINRWVDPIFKFKEKTGTRHLRYNSFAQMCAVHSRHKGFVLLCIELGMTLKEALDVSYQVPDELGMQLTDPVLKKSFVAFSMNDAVRKVLVARGLSERTLNPRAIWKYMILDHASFEEALFRAIGEIGPKRSYKARYIGSEYGFVVFHDGKYTSSYWVDPNTGRKFESFPKMCKCYVTTPARVETALKNGMALGTALVKTGLPLARDAKEVF